MSVQRAQYEITSSEFIDWIAYLDIEINEFHREDYFWANIVAEIRRWHVKDYQTPKLEEHLIKFQSKQRAKKTNLSVEEKTKKAKSFFGFLLKFPKGKK